MHHEEQIQPLVSCIMPTCNRRAFVSNAIRYFLQQDYENKELVIVDDGTDCIQDLVPLQPQIRYIRIAKTMTLGKKRNFCIQESKGDLLMHWDDDDWMANNRISYQVNELLKHGTEVCGLQQMYFYERGTGRSWLYKYPANGRPWLAGGSLLYTRNFWKTKPFPDMQVASDTQFIFSRKLDKYTVLNDYSFYIASIHEKNTSPKKTNNSVWNSIPSTIIKDIMRNDWEHYPANNGKENNIPADQSSSKKKVAILITTCHRPGPLKKIMEALEKEKNNYDIAFFIVDDGILKNGKKNYWKTINMLWSQVRNREFDYFIQIPDDVSWEGELISKAIDQWEQIKDPQKICLNLLLDGSRLGSTCWTNYWPVLKSFGKNRYIKTQWVDMIYICEKKFFAQLNWTIHPVPLSRWVANPDLSSGVGQQISLRLHQGQVNLYQVTQSLLQHEDHGSIMNPGIRKKEPLIAVNLPVIYAGMASIPGRESQLRKAISGIIPYVDQLFLFLNDYKNIPAWLYSFEKITILQDKNENFCLGDGGKFFGLNKISEKDFFYFTLDDDIIYPPDYIWKMIRKIDQFHRKAIVGCGGYIMNPQVNDFYNDRKYNWHISTQNKEDRPVQILHTAFTAWHSSAIGFRPEECKKANMGDIWLAIAAQKNKVPMILVERPANWATIQPLPDAKTIYGRYRNNCKEQTEVFNSLPEWKLIE